MREDRGVMIVSRQACPEVSVLAPDSPWASLDALLGPQPAGTYVLDFAQERYLTSEALSVLVNIVRRIQHAGGRLIIIHAAPPVLSVLESTRLARLVTVAPTLEAARAGG